MTDYLQEAKDHLSISITQNRLEMANMHSQQAIAYALIALIEMLQNKGGGEKKCPRSAESSTPK